MHAFKLLKVGFVECGSSLIHILKNRIMCPSFEIYLGPYHVEVLLFFGPNAFDMCYVPYKDAMSATTGSKYVLNDFFDFIIFSFFYLKIYDDMILLIRSIFFVTMFCWHRAVVRALLSVQDVGSPPSTG